ncbi:MAG: transcription-repair coupling factor [Balneolaceae bacterium]|nr:MAG: transcription-repair coupling factor [Balneolaceae bacterium]
MAVKELKDRISSLFPVAGIVAHLNNKQHVRLDHYHGSLQAFLVHRLLNKDNRNLLVLFPDHESAQFFKSDIDSLNDMESLLFPPYSHKPYDTNQPFNSQILIERSEILEQLTRVERSFLIASVESVFEKIAPPSIFSESTILVKKGEEIEPGRLIEKLVGQKYDSVNFVERPGEFASRGGILDVFPFTGDYPVRLEFFGNEIDSIREFDPDSQRSVSFRDEVRLVPNINSLVTSGRQSLFEYLPADTSVVLVNDALVTANFRNLIDEASEAYTLSGSSEPPESLFITNDEYDKWINNRSVLYLGGITNRNDYSFRHSIDAKPQPGFNGSVKLLREHILQLSKKEISTYILCDSDGQLERFEELLGESSHELNYHLAVDTIHEGFLLEQAGIAVYTDHQIFNRYHRPKLKQKKRTGGISLKELKDLQAGDYVVHIDYGIGRFSGFRNIEVKGSMQEAIVIKYQEGSTLYVNVSSLHKVQKFSGKDGHQPKITKLGSGEWARKKAKTKSRVKDIARELIRLYAVRRARKAFAFSPDNAMLTELEASFIYEETPDQMQAIDDVKSDMMNDMPMDRLVCGDVGFGKTEVAVRAAFKAVLDGKQVAVLVPTTILADQHYKTFRNRMSHFPVNVEAISRFRTKAEQTDILKRTAMGEVDILIGTHRLTSKDVTFKDLGLLIIDEEQRFGVATKEKIKEFRVEVDVLTLTATPIPRTLQFSLMGARDLSIINTPPPNRQPVRTEIHGFDSKLVQDVIRQELSRGGQVFFIHNRVANIEEISSMIIDLVPEARVRFAHGQMKGPQLEKIILDFYHNKYDVLVSTNIVENGIDIANANTIIINHAHQFGLSELHQLRGRVGRSNRKAYCYLIAPPFQSLPMDSRKRLMALVEYSDLGAGLNIAMRDLDIRGAGDILGGEQSGFINDIGFDLYNKILNEAVNELKESEFSDIFKDVKVEVALPDTSVEFDLPAMLPTSYVSDSVERLNLYRKLAKAATRDDVMAWKDELTDRFGPVPDSGINLVSASLIKLYASRNFFEKITVRDGRMWISCPVHNSDHGREFYDSGKFQEIVKQVEQTTRGDFKLIQKNDAVRIVIHNIPTLEASVTFLESLTEDKPVETLA